MGSADSRVLLAIDTTGKRCAAALCMRGMVLGELALEGGKAHGETLAPAIDALFSLTGVSPKSLAAIACSAGPGSFTGIRIGAAAAKGLALGLDIPLVPVDTLAALAYAAYALGGLAGGAVYAPVIDARRGQVYSGFYSFRDEGVLPGVLAEPACRMFTDVLAAAGSFAHTVFTGDGADGREAVISAVSGCCVVNKEIRYQSAFAVGALGFAMLDDTRANAVRPYGVGDFEPFYARLAQAEQDLKDRAGK